MGIVYRARDKRLKRHVAIKVLPPELSFRRDIRSRFLREAETAAQLSHPNIVPIYSVDEVGNLVFFVMAVIEGDNLAVRLRKRGPCPVDDVQRWLTEVGDALAYAHSRGVIHRDIKPDNILLDGIDGRALVTDFGIARAAMDSGETSRLTATGMAIGTPAYMSPEQASGDRDLDARSDLYSLGIAGYYALTGRLPFDGDTSAEVVTQQLTATAPSITSVAPSVPPRLASAVERCLHKEPIRRYRNAESFAEAIDLAFEHAKEIPAPLRVWLNQGQKELPARLAFVGIGTMTGITLAFSVTNGVWAPIQFALWFLVPFVPLMALSFVPSYFRLRRVLGEGYRVDDLYAAMREHQLALAEEIEYERRQSSPRFKKFMRVMFGGSLGGVGIGAYIWRHAGDVFRNFSGAGTLDLYWDIQEQAVRILFVTASTLTISAVALGGEFVRLHLAHRISTRAIAFWKGKWGARLARAASLFLKKAERPTLGMPLLTEVALGRATDHLFEALPKASRRELAALPETVRRLEGDAGKLRDSIIKLDDQLAVFERGGDSLHDAERTRVAEELRATRALASQRLAATVAALESIRLDLLRLQMGSAGIESVTASIEAARRIGDQIGDAVAAQDEVERLLRQVTPSHGSLALPPSGTAPSDDGDDDDDAHTPIDGVTAARG
jgi:serine/threonine-protein kinase